jgi:hypothetical protein
VFPDIYFHRAVKGTYSALYAARGIGHYLTLGAIGDAFFFLAE